jgi:hypothetical protein
MSDIVKPHQREAQRQQAQARQARETEDRRRRQAQLAAALEDDANRARAAELLAQLVAPDAALSLAQAITLVATAQLVLDGALREMRAWPGEKEAAELRTHLRRLRR